MTLLPGNRAVLMCTWSHTVLAYAQHAPGKEVEAVSISYNGKLIATGSRDGALHFPTHSAMISGIVSLVVISFRKSLRFSDSRLSQG
jgi:hypothetical protein